MLQFDVALCRARDNVAHLSALPMRQAGKVRRYIHFFVASELVSDVERFVPDRVHVARTNNNQVRLWRISAFLTLSSLKGTKRRLFMMVHIYNHLLSLDIPGQ